MKFKKENSLVYIFDDKPETKAFQETTHLAISAHQDDIEFMAYHGIVECFGSRDKHFSAVVVTNGSGSPRSGVYADFSDEEMMAVRVKEQKKAAFVGEYSTLSMLAYPSCEVKDKNNTDVVEDLVQILKETKPEVIYTHNLADKHDTHVSVVCRVIAAIRQLPKADRPKKVYGCEVWRGLDWFSDGKKIKLDVGRKVNIARAVMGVFDSQISGGKQYDTATIGRRVANATYADDHAVDTYEQATYAMDLTPLIENDNLSVSNFITDYIQDFQNDVEAKLEKFN